MGKSDHCFAGGSRGIVAESNDAGAGTAVENFDAYGERLPDSAHSTIEFSGTRSAVLLRSVRVLCFWGARCRYCAGSPVLFLGGPTV